MTRGLWLIVLELTFVRCLGWTFNFNYHYLMAGILWALGWSMIALAALIHLPKIALAVFGIVMIATHDLCDSLRPRDFGPLSWLWKVLHTSRQAKPFDDVTFKIAYPLIPWIGVMAVGYAFGSLFLRPARSRRALFSKLSIGMVLGFVLVRASNLYGDPHPWTRQGNAVFTLFSFINCDKYPPSLLFLLMTLGPTIGALALLDYAAISTRLGIGMLRRTFCVFGRVPLFYYLLHLPPIHGLAVLFAIARYGHAPWLFENPVLSRNCIARKFRDSRDLAIGKGRLYRRELGA